MARLHQRLFGIALALALGLGFWLGAPGDARAAGDSSYRTDVIFVSFMAPDQAIALWERVIGPAAEARIMPGRADTVVVYDTPVRLARFRALLAALDVAGDQAERLYVRPVVHLPASELARLIVAVLTEPTPNLVLVPDDRSGQLIVRTTLARYTLIDRLARHLDVPAAGDERAVRPVPAPEAP